MKRAPLLLSLLFTACAAQPSTGGHVFSLVSPAEERAIGESAATQVLDADGLYRPASKTTAYVTGICNKIFAATEAAVQPLQCNLIDDGDFNAAATPGYMLINRGLLPFINSEGELAAVLGHESGHLMARHITQSVTHAKLAGLAMLGGTLAAGGSAGATEAVQGVGTQAAQLTLMTFSRSQETEADALGRRYMKNAGYNPREGVNMVQAMLMYDNYQQQQSIAFNNGEIAPGSLLDQLKSSHPSSPQRVAAAIAEVGQPVDSETAGRKRYMAAIEGLTFGPARRYGIARKGQLVLTRQRVVVPLPSGATTAYISSHQHKFLGNWLVAHPQSGTYFDITAIKTLAGHNPASVVQSLLPALHGPVQRISLGTGGKAQTGYTAGYHYLMNNRRYRLLAVSSPPEVNEMVVITIVYPNDQVEAQENDSLMRVLQPMQFLSKDQALKYRQLQLHTFTATAADTVAARAAALPVGAMREELFRALNNLMPPARMQPGQIYKTVIDPN